MHVYKHVFGNARSGLPIATIPAYGATARKEINAGVEAQATFQLDQTGRNNQTLINATRVGRSFWVIERDGLPVWDGLITSNTYQSQAKSVQLFGRTIPGYPNRIIMDESFIPSSGISIQGDIVENFLFLWALLQSKPETNLNVQLPESFQTGVERTLIVTPSDRKTFGDLMSEQADGDPGFDWRIVTTKVRNLYQRHLQIGFPTLGTAGDPRLRFNYPGSVFNYWRTENVGDSGTHVTGHGTGSGESSLTVQVVHQDMLDANFMRWDVEVDFDQVNDLPTLIALLNQEANNHKLPGIKYTVQVRGDKTPIFGSFDVGDGCQLILHDPRHPTKTKVNTRIAGWQLTIPSAEEAEVVQLSFPGGDEGV
jgi:hypothetical protein